MHRNCPVCRSEGFTAHKRVLLRNRERQIIATLYQTTDNMIGPHEAALSESAWRALGLRTEDHIRVEHPEPIQSLSHLRGRIYGHRFNDNALHEVIRDIVGGNYSDIHIAAFVAACATPALDEKEVLGLTRAMVNAGDRLSWNADVVADKHSVGGLPGNRTTPIVVSIVAALGLTIPKTSSHAITSPAGTADTMETLAPVDLDIATIHRVVEQEGGCIASGGAVRLSPADDILIRVERALDIDTEGQLIASVLSKKIAAGSTHLVIDMPVGPTAKVRTHEAARQLAAGLSTTAAVFGMKLRVMESDGTQPIGRGIGPALEARDVLAVLRCERGAPPDLRKRALALAGALLEMAGTAADGGGEALAAQCLNDGRALRKFERICEAQGGMRVPPQAAQRAPIAALHDGRIASIDNRRIATLAKLAGAPEAKAAGVELHVRIGGRVARSNALCTVHAESPGELSYALAYAVANPDIFRVTA
jgi:thymidine phosphorylase